VYHLEFSIQSRSAQSRDRTRYAISKYGLTTADYFPQRDVPADAVFDCEGVLIMTTPAKHMLLTAISERANYKEKQLIKSGELGACAASIIKRLRKTVRLYHCLFIAFLAIPVIVQVVAWVFSPERPTMWPSFVYGGLLAMTQLPNIIIHHVLLSKLETIVAMWLYTYTDETDQPPSYSDAQLAELVASQF